MCFCFSLDCLFSLLNLLAMYHQVISLHWAISVVEVFHKLNHKLITELLPVNLGLLGSLASLLQAPILFELFQAYTLGLQAVPSLSPDWLHLVLSKLVALTQLYWWFVTDPVGPTAPTLHHSTPLLPRIKGWPFIWP